jgi:hypothetical protein
VGDLEERELEAAGLLGQRRRRALAVLEQPEPEAGEPVAGEPLQEGALLGRTGERDPGREQQLDRLMSVGRPVGIRRPVAGRAQVFASGDCSARQLAPAAHHASHLSRQDSAHEQRSDRRGVRRTS